MKKILVVSLIGILFLSSCNFPLLKPTPDQSAVATKVAQALTQTVLPGPLPSQTTSGSTPSATSSSIEATPTITSTSTATITATPSDPSQMYGAPYWHNGMDSGASFGLSTPYNDGYSAFSISGGKMTMTGISLGGWKGWRLTDRKLANYYMEDIFNVQSCTGMGSYGIVFRSPDYSTGFGYYLGITCDGQYSLMRWSSSGETYIQNWKTSPEIVAGSNQTNKVGVLVKGNDIQIFINGKQVQSISDATFPTQTIIGVFIASMTTPNFTVDVDQIDMWQIP